MKSHIYTLRAWICAWCICMSVLTDSIIVTAQQAGGTDIVFTIKDQLTGFAVAGATVKVTGAGGEQATLQAASNGELRFRAVKGKYSFTFLAKDYQPLSTSFTAGQESLIDAGIQLDPVGSKQSAAASPQRVLPGNQLRLTGYVSDAGTHGPLAGATITVAGHTATTDGRGYFAVQFAVPAIDMAKGDIPDKVSVQASKPGYGTYTIQQFYLIPERYTLKLELVDAKAGGLGTAGRVQTLHKVAVMQHGMFDRTVADEQQREVDSRRAAAVSPVAATVPGSIRVGLNCSCKNCSSVQVMSLEAYTESGLDQEWIASWRAASLQAGAVAYRSYGAWHVQNPVASNYDISNTTCSQVWAGDVVASTRDAARATVGRILTKGGGIFRSEYSSENNNAGCGNGFSGTGSTWPCISDARCAGRAKYGHGRGMCQWGSSFWASDKDYMWILNHYYNPGGVLVQAPYLLISNGVYRVLNHNSGKSLDARGCSGNNSVQMNQWDWWGGDCQRWRFEHVGDGWYKISGMISGRVLDVPSCSGNDGTVLQFWDWLDNDCQRWRLEDAGGGLVRIVNKASGKVMEIGGGSLDNGGTVMQYSWNGGNWQKWRLNVVSTNYIAEGTYTLSTVSNGKALQAQDCSTAWGTGMSQWEQNGTDCQRWRIEPTADGFYRLVSVKTGLVLDVASCNQEQGGSLIQWEWLDNDCQRWNFEHLGDGRYKVIAYTSGKVLDASDTSNGARVYQWDWWGGANQQWVLNAAAAAKAAPVLVEDDKSVMRLAPNPVQAGSLVQLTYLQNSKAGGAGILLVSDHNGRIVQRQQLSLQPGSNRISVATSGWPAGIYYISIRALASGTTTQERLVVVQ